MVPRLMDSLTASLVKIRLGQKCLLILSALAFNTLPLIDMKRAHKIGHRSLREKTGDLIPDQSDESFKVSLGWQNDLLGDKEQGILKGEVSLY
jgi:hypothetical protein